jgi:hypothetical protein
MLLPFLILLIPSLEHLMGEHEYTHLFFAILIWPTALLAFIPAYKHHKKKWILVTAVLGLVLITSSLLAHEYFNETIEAVVSIVGSFILVFAHYQNYICNKCSSCHEHKPSEHSH